MFELPGIMKTEAFWATALGIASLLLMAAIILIGRYRHPEIYSKKRNRKTEISEKEKT